MRQAIGLHSVPHFTTLQKASRRLLRLGHVRRLLNSTVQRVLKRRRLVSYAAGDSSGFDARHASRYYVHRRDADKSDENRPKKRVIYQRFGKLMLIVCCLSSRHPGSGGVGGTHARHRSTRRRAGGDTQTAAIAAHGSGRGLRLGPQPPPAARGSRDRLDHPAQTWPASRRSAELAQGQIPAADENPLQPQSLPKTPAGGDGILNAQTQLGLGSSRPKPPLAAARHAAAGAAHNITLALLRVFYRAGSDPFMTDGSRRVGRQRCQDVRNVPYRQFAIATASR